MILVVLLNAAALAEDPKPPFQNYELTDEEIAKALEGENCPWSGSIRNVFSGDQLTKSGTGLVLLDSKSDKWASGIWIRVLTPYSWICEQAKEAERRFMPFAIEDVTEEMRRPVLRVYASPGKILKDARKKGLEDHGMTHVTFRSTAKKNFEALEPVSVEEEKRSVEDIDEERTHYPTLIVLFDLEEVARISKLDEKGEVFVVLTNNFGKERKLKIKTKHFKKLP
jgi:hypothetical protein